ncbi:MAG TPA: GNAT family N-acetyltransferase [Bacteroidales bacterium]|mgnify:CR=1 FL=1|nr:GNAT family N-acetyltransferase [Bacteroidales bacterium]
MNVDKDTYRKFCRETSQLSVFIRDWWLDAVCGEDNWDVVLEEKNQTIITALPFYKVKKGMFKGITLPPLTPHLGPYIFYPPDQKYSSKLSYEKEIMSNLIEKLPRFDFFVQSFSPSFTNWLPFYWKGFLQTTRYTYILDDLTDPDRLISDFSHEKRKNLKRAEQILTVRSDWTPDEFYTHHKSSLAKTGQKINYSPELFRRIVQAAMEHHAGRIVYAIDEKGVVHGALFIVWDENSGYDLVSTIDPDLRSSGSIALLIKEMLIYLSSRTKSFDFEGSMIENVENSFRHFGAKQIPYFKIMKYNSMILRIIKGIRHNA